MECPEAGNSTLASILPCLHRTRQRREYYGSERGTDLANPTPPDSSRGAVSAAPFSLLTPSPSRASARCSGFSGLSAASARERDFWPSVPVLNLNVEESGGRAGGCGSTEAILIACADDAHPVLRPPEQVPSPFPDTRDAVDQVSIPASSSARMAV